MPSTHSISSSHTIEAHSDLIRQSVESTFAAFCEEAPTYAGDGRVPAPFDGMVGVMSLVGDVAWTIMLGLPHETAAPLAARFAGFEIEYGTDDMSDVVGELTNVLAGDLSARLDQAGVRTELSLPTIAEGSDLRLHLSDASALNVMHFASPDGAFWLLVAAAEPH